MKPSGLPDDWPDTISLDQIDAILLYWHSRETFYLSDVPQMEGLFEVTESRDYSDDLRVVRARIAMWTELRALKVSGKQITTRFRELLPNVGKSVL